MKKILTSAILLAVASTAQASPQLYGAINLGVANNTSSDTMNMGSYSSKVGIKGEQEINQKLTGIYKVELGTDISGDSTAISTYNTIIGVKGKMGTAYVGRMDTPYKQASSADVFANTAIDSQHGASGVIGAGGWDNRTNNTIGYESPKLGHVTFMAAGAVDQTAGSNDIFGTTSYAAKYKDSNVMASIAYENNATSDTSAFKMTASIKQDKATVAGTYEVADRFGEKDVSSMLVSAKYKYTDDVEIIGQYGTVESAINDDLESRLSVGVAHSLAKNTNVYAAWNTDSMGSAGNANSLIAGLQHSF